MTSDYVELRTRSAFSFLEGASTPEDLALRAAELGYGALALGDRDGFYGAPRFHQAAKSAGIKPMVGAELTLDDNSRLYVLVPDRPCYQSLCRMITDTKLRAAKGQGRITLADLERYGHGMICLAGGVLSPLARMLVRGEHPLPLRERLTQSSAEKISTSTCSVISTPAKSGLIANSPNSAIIMTICLRCSNAAGLTSARRASVCWLSWCASFRAFRAISASIAAAW